MTDAQEFELVSTRLERIAKKASESPQVAFTSLNHHLDLGLLHEAFELTRRDGAPGVDGQTARAYEENLIRNLKDLLERAKSGSYRAPPVRRVHIPKGTGPETRPIGIPTFEDKVLQRAVSMILGAIYEQDFHPCSFGFRPGRSAHQALESIWKQSMGLGGGWLLEVDIRSYFDALDHKHLRAILDRRVRDGVLRRLIDKWLKAGVWEAGHISHPDSGTPQGGVISPLLANIYLHEVLDTWFHRDVLPRMKGRAFLVRYADDFVIGFASKADADKVMDVLPKRFGRFGLTLHPKKTRMVDFRRPSDRSDDSGGDGLPRSFDFLAFRHFWGKSRKGQWVIRQKTAPSRFTRALSKVRAWCRRHRHWPVEEQHGSLVLKLRGHYQYFGLTGNYRALARFKEGVERAWQKWLNRRSQGKHMPWPRFHRLLGRYPLPAPTVCQSVFRTRGKPHGPRSRMR